MGMAASQVRFLQLTERKSDIGRQLMQLSSDKTALTRDMQKVTMDYQNSLNQKVLKWSNNNGVNCTKLGYDTLMRPCTANGNKPVLVSDSSGRIVIDSRYKKYAEMISPSGAAGGNYSGATRDAILLELVNGTSSELFATGERASSQLDARKKAMTEALLNLQEVENKKTKKIGSSVFINKFLNFGSGEEINSSNADTYAKRIKGALAGKGYLTSSDYDNFEKACDENIKDIKYGKTMSVPEFIKSVVAAFYGDSDAVMVMMDSKGNSTQAEYDAAKEAYEKAKEEYTKAAGNDAEVFTSEQEVEIAFYDRLFGSIVELGWSYDGGVQDSGYLSQMLQNNSYFITTVSENIGYDSTKAKSASNYQYSFDTNPVSNFSNIYVVNDTDASNEALAKYEYEKSKINEKESRIDTKMKDLETEQSAISKMLESIDQVKGDNIERTFGIWG